MSHKIFLSMRLYKIVQKLFGCGNQMDFQNKIKIGEIDWSRTNRALWDTGSMVSVVDKVAQYFPERELLPVEEVLGVEKIQIQVTNDTDILLDGVIFLEFLLCQDSPGFTIPFLVTDQRIWEPIVGLM